MVWTEHQIDEVHKNGDKVTHSCCILVSHQELSLKFVWAGSHYYYTIIRQPQKKFGYWTRKATLPVKE